MAEGKEGNRLAARSGRNPAGVSRTAFQFRIKLRIDSAKQSFYEATIQICHSERSEESLREILYGIYLERQREMLRFTQHDNERRVQGDTLGVLLSYRLIK